MFNKTHFPNSTDLLTEVSSRSFVVHRMGHGSKNEHEVLKTPSLCTFGLRTISKSCAGISYTEVQILNIQETKNLLMTIGTSVSKVQIIEVKRGDTYIYNSMCLNRNKGKSPIIVL